MALDGIVISNLIYDLDRTVKGARISKIAQPETDELLFTLKGPGGQTRLSISASASAPAQAHRQRTHYGYFPAGLRADHQVRDRASGRNGRSAS